MRVHIVIHRFSCSQEATMFVTWHIVLVTANDHAVFLSRQSGRRIASSRWLAADTETRRRSSTTLFLRLHTSYDKFCTCHAGASWYEHHQCMWYTVQLRYCTHIKLILIAHRMSDSISRVISARVFPNVDFVLISGVETRRTICDSSYCVVLIALFVVSDTLFETSFATWNWLAFYSLWGPP